MNSVGREPSWNSVIPFQCMEKEAFRQNIIQHITVDKQDKSVCSLWKSLWEKSFPKKAHGLPVYENGNRNISFLHISNLKFVSFAIPTHLLN